MVEPSRVNTGRTIDHAEVDNLPLTSRNPYNFIIFQPGVSGHPNPELGIPRTLNTNGLLDRINYQMDGMVDTESDRYGLRLFPISDIYVREVQTVSNSFAPEFGNTAGDIFNVITNSGTNRRTASSTTSAGPWTWPRGPCCCRCAARSRISRLNDFAVNAERPHHQGQAVYLRRLRAPEARPARAQHDQPVRCRGHRASRQSAGGGAQRPARAIRQRPRGLDHQRQEPVLLPLQLFPQRVSVQHRGGRQERAGRGRRFPGPRARDGRAGAHDVFPTVLNELRFGWPYRNEHHIADPLTGAGPQINISGVANFNGSNAVRRPLPGEDSEPE